ncbi:unnamed protein product [Lota lota]
MVCSRGSGLAPGSCAGETGGVRPWSWMAQVQRGRRGPTTSPGPGGFGACSPTELPVRGKGGVIPDPPGTRQGRVAVESHVSLTFLWKRGGSTSQTEGLFKAKLSETMAALLLKQLLDRTADESSVAR